MAMIESNDNDKGCLIQFLIAVVLILGSLFFCFARVHPKGQPGLIIGKSPESTMTAFEQAVVIKAKADAATQATDDEIKLRWHIHLMRWRWGWLSVAYLLIFVGAGLLASWLLYRVGLLK